MCVYNGRKVSRAEFNRKKALEKELRNAMDTPVQYAYDYRDWPIVRPSAYGGTEIIMAHWELIPPSVQRRHELPAFRKEFTTFFARGETIMDTGMYREAAMQRRCLVLSSHYFEYRHVGDQKIPYRIGVKDEEMFYMAGIWQQWIDRSVGGKPINTFALLTTKANSMVAQIHNEQKRMAVILPKQQAHDWLFKPLTPAEIRALATYQFPAERMINWTVAKDFYKSEDPEKYVHYGQISPIVDGVRHIDTVRQQSLFDAV